MGTDGYHTHQPTPAVPLPHHPASTVPHHQHPAVVPSIGVIVPAVPHIPTPAPAIAVLPNIVLRTPKAAKDIEEASKKTEVDGQSSASDKLVQGEEASEKPKKKNTKLKSKSAVVFRD